MAALSGVPAMACVFDEHIAKIKEKLQRNRFATFNTQECWIYQGNGPDHLESLVCPVVISADELPKVIATSKGGVKNA